MMTLAEAERRVTPRTLAVAVDRAIADALARHDCRLCSMPAESWCSGCEAWYCAEHARRHLCRSRNR